MLKVFLPREIHAAEAYAANNGTAVHVHTILTRTAPQCFVQAVNRGEWIAHLVDQNKERLIKFAKKLGVKVIYIDREGEGFQHIDLCGKPLRTLLEMLEFPFLVRDYREDGSHIKTVTLNPKERTLFDP